MVLAKDYSIERNVQATLDVLNEIIRFRAADSDPALRLVGFLLISEQDCNDVVRV